MAAKRVLIVDDALELGRLLQAAIVTLNAGLQITVVPSAEEAQLEANRNPAELIVTDVRLPGISGVELTRRIRARDKLVKIILITALLDPSLRQQAMDAGADYFFKKPISMPDFLNAVAKLLGIASVPQPVHIPSQSAKELAGPQQNLEKSQADHRIADCLAALRQSLAASTVALMDERERILLQDGEPATESLDPTLLQALSSAVSAGEKVSRILGNKTPETAYAFKSRGLDLVVSPLGGAFTILAIMKSPRTPVRTAIAVDEIMATRKELERILAEMGVTLRPLQPKRVTGPLNPERLAQSPQVKKTPSTPLPVRPSGTILLEPTSPPKNVPAAEQPASDPNLETLLKDKGKLREEDIEAFWEAALKDENQSHLGQSDRLSYDQARRMGLAPDTSKPSTKT